MCKPPEYMNEQEFEEYLKDNGISTTAQIGGDGKNLLLHPNKCSREEKKDVLKQGESSACFKFTLQEHKEVFRCPYLIKEEEDFQYWWIYC